MPPSPGREGHGLFQGCFHPVPWLPSQLEIVVLFPWATELPKHGGKALSHLCVGGGMKEINEGGEEREGEIRGACPASQRSCTASARPWGLEAAGVPWAPATCTQLLTSMWWRHLGPCLQGTARESTVVHSGPGTP